MKYDSDLQKLSNRRSILIRKVMEGSKLNVSEENELKTINAKITGIFKKTGVKFPNDQ